MSKIAVRVSICDTAEAERGVVRAKRQAFEHVFLRAVGRALEPGLSFL
jgi:sulfur relay (sulfurtransferase) complex TusBCD TusD component (DsrE family)